MASKKELIISFIHSNYCIRSAGTEKFVKEYSKLLQEHGYSHLNFFSFADHKGFGGQKIIGVNLDDRFLGIYRYDRIQQIIDSILAEHDYRLNSIHLQHLLYHDLSLISRIILHYHADVYAFVHDFYFLCPSVHLINSNSDYCGSALPSEEKCGRCTFYGEAVRHREKVDLFLTEIAPVLKRVLVPSLFVKRIVKDAFPSIKGLVYVRPHLIMSGNGSYVPANGKVKLAFIGRKIEQKGYDYWQNLAGIISSGKVSKDYELYYFGLDIEDGSQYIEEYVSTAQQGSNAMRQALERNHIDCAFLWPRCPETYSFAYYELLCSGVYVITNNHSGNIREQIEYYENGVDFSTYEECVNWMSDPNRVREEINKYRNSSKQKPVEFRPNPEISSFISTTSYSEKNRDVKKPRKDVLSTLLYKLKFRKTIR